MGRSFLDGERAGDFVHLGVDGGCAVVVFLGDRGDRLGAGQGGGGFVGVRPDRHLTLGLAGSYLKSASRPDAASAHKWSVLAVGETHMALGKRGLVEPFLRLGLGAAGEPAVLLAENPAEPSAGMAPA